MSEEHYEPVSCDYHDELEAAAMHKSRVELEFDLDGVSQRGRGQIADVYTAVATVRRMAWYRPPRSLATC